MTKKKKSGRKPQGLKEDVAKKKKKSSRGNKALRVGVIEAILIAEGFSRLIDLLAGAGGLSFATSLREKLFQAHERSVADSSDGEGESAYVRLMNLQDKFFIDDLIRLVLTEYPASGFPQKGEISEATLEALVVDIYDDRSCRHEAYVRLASFFEKAILLDSVKNAPVTIPVEPSRL
ncbi:hypothetical protein [Xanthomonas dyei]|uniref:hypothetical protein n=1 Tax=Xanthomonas dyei TaxID=743699 RepID=UPI001E480D44|nr:hypothetical protein [Xanthomonas dyei]MCC4632800.1 hypothetical protein [Xanthomonas dyei pv. eucalypti]